MIEPIMLSMEQIAEIHKTRPLTVLECEQMLEYRRRYGDLHPDNIKIEQERFFKSLERLK